MCLCPVIFALQSFKQPGEDEKEEERKKKATESITEKTKKMDLKDEPQVRTEDKHCLWKVPAVNSCQIIHRVRMISTQPTCAEWNVKTGH